MIRSKTVSRRRKPRGLGGLSTIGAQHVKVLVPEWQAETDSLILEGTKAR